MKTTLQLLSLGSLILVCSAILPLPTEWTAKTDSVTSADGILNVETSALWIVTKDGIYLKKGNAASIFLSSNNATYSVWNGAYKTCDCFSGRDYPDMYFPITDFSAEQALPCFDTANSPPNRLPRWGLQYSKASSNHGYTLSMFVSNGNPIWFSSSGEGTPITAHIFRSFTPSVSKQDKQKLVLPAYCPKICPTFK